MKLTRYQGREAYRAAVEAIAVRAENRVAFEASERRARELRRENQRRAVAAGGAK